MDTKKYIGIAIVTIAASGAAFFALSQWRESDVRSAAPSVARQHTERVGVVSAPQKNIGSFVEQKKEVIDYRKILEKFQGEDVESVPVSEKVVALTFDGGGNAQGVETVVKTLTRENVPATFFLTGKFIEGFPEAVRAIQEMPEGMSEIANHTYSHADLLKLNGDEIKQEIMRVTTLCSSCKPFFRFPYGARSKELIRQVNDLGFTAVRWSVDSWGWQGAKDGRDTTFITDRVVSKSTPGGIVLMHLGSAQDSTTFDADALQDIIVRLRAEGYHFTILSELFNV